jgi:O-antigen/teichoic acid export membrane protein
MPSDPTFDVSTNSLEAAQFRRQMGTISRHSAVFLLGTVFTSAIGYAFKVYLARTLGAESLGIYTLGMTMVGFLGVFNALGLPQAAVRFVAAYSGQNQSEKLRIFLRWSLLVLFASTLFFGGFLLLAGPTVAVRFYHTPALIPYLRLFALIMTLGVFTTFLSQVLTGYHQVARRTAIVSFVGSPLTMVFTLLLAALGWGLRGYIAAQIGSAVFVLVLLGFSVWRLTPKSEGPPVSPDYSIRGEVVTFSATVFGTGFLEYLLSQADGVLIGYFRSAREIGIYAVTGALVTFVPVILQSVNQIFSPMIASLHARGESEMLKRIFQTLTKWIIGLTLPLAGVMIVFASQIMHIFGSAFEPGWPVLVIGTIGQVINCSVGSVGFLLLMSGHQGTLIRVEAAMAVVMIALNLALVPRWGIVGAAVAAAVTTALMNLWYLIKVRQKLRIIPYTSSYRRMVVPALTLCLALVIAKGGLRQVHPDWLAVGLGLAFAYVAFLAVALFSGLDDDDRLIVDAVRARLLGWRMATGGNAA